MDSHSICPEVLIAQTRSLWCNKQAIIAVMRFASKKPVIAMIHVGALPGTPAARSNLLGLEASALREAKLRLGHACIEDIDYPARRQLDRSLVRQLATCTWVEQHHNVVITGPTGVGKTYVACALAQQACRKGYRALYRRVPRLFGELALARADGTYPRLLTRLARIDVLVLDDFGLAPLEAQQRQDLLEVLEDRHDLHSTVVASQLPVQNWHAHIEEPTLADAICERLLHNAHRLMLKGPTRRKLEPRSD